MSNFLSLHSNDKLSKAYDNYFSRKSGLDENNEYLLYLKSEVTRLKKYVKAIVNKLKQAKLDMLEAKNNLTSFVESSKTRLDEDDRMDGNGGKKNSGNKVRRIYNGTKNYPVELTEEDIALYSDERDYNIDMTEEDINNLLDEDVTFPENDDDE